MCGKNSVGASAIRMRVNEREVEKNADIEEREAAQECEIANEKKMKK